MRLHLPLRVHHHHVNHPRDHHCHVPSPLSFYLVCSYNHSNLLRCVSHPPSTTDASIAATALPSAHLRPGLHRECCTSLEYPRRYSVHFISPAPRLRPPRSLPSNNRNPPTSGPAPRLYYRRSVYYVSPTPPPSPRPTAPTAGRGVTSSFPPPKHNERFIQRRRRRRPSRDECLRPSVHCA